MTSRPVRPRRSVLYMPGSNARALEKAATLPADALILDLEDAVAPDAKPEARTRVCDAVRSGAYGAKELTIRINGEGTEWHAHDLAAACAAGPDGIVVPKVDSAAAVGRLVDAMEAAGAPAHTKLWAILETPVAVLHAEEIATASARLAVLGSWERLEICPADDCLRAFFDRSRNRSRTWCSMQVCGNREKARTFRKRTRAQNTEHQNSTLATA